MDPAVPVAEFLSQTGLEARLFRTERLLAFVSTAFGIVAMLLAAIGLFGVLAYAVARRRNEIGVRMALGAASGDIIQMVLRDSLWMVLAGLLVGLPGAYGVARFLEASLFGLGPIDPVSAGSALAILLLVALTAASLPARRAAPRQSSKRAPRGIATRSEPLDEKVRPADLDDTEESVRHRLTELSK